MPTIQEQSITSAQKGSLEMTYLPTEVVLYMRIAENCRASPCTLVQRTPGNDGRRGEPWGVCWGMASALTTSRILPKQWLEPPTVRSMTLMLVAPRRRSLAANEQRALFLGQERPMYYALATHATSCALEVNHSHMVISKYNMYVGRTTTDSISLTMIQLLRADSRKPEESTVE